MLNDEDLSRIAVAIADQGNSSHNTPSGPILELMRQFAIEGKIGNVAFAYREFIKYHPNAKAFVKASIPAIVSNYITSFCCQTLWPKWSVENVGWADEIKDCLAKPELFNVCVRNLVEKVNAYDK